MNRFRWAKALACLGLVVGAGVVATTASSSGEAKKVITPSPVWTAAQLNAPAGDNWLNYYGPLDGSRYSSLNQITTTNVSAAPTPIHRVLAGFFLCGVLVVGEATVTPWVWLERERW